MRKIKKFFKDLKEFFKDNITDIIIAMFSVVVGIVAFLVLGDNTLGILSNILQVLTTVIAALAWNKARLALQKRKHIDVKIDGNDLVLAVSLLGDTKPNIAQLIKRENVKLAEIKDDETMIHQGANNYLSLNISLLKDPVSDDNIGKVFEIKSMDERNIIPDNDPECLADYIEDLKECLNQAYLYTNKNAIPQIHMFIFAPVAFASFTVPPFANKKSVVIYHLRKEKDGREYIRVGEL